MKQPTRNDSSFLDPLRAALAEYDKNLAPAFERRWRTVSETNDVVALQADESREPEKLQLVFYTCTKHLNSLDKCRLLSLQNIRQAVRIRPSKASTSSMSP